MPKHLFRFGFYAASAIAVAACTPSQPTDNGTPNEAGNGTDHSRPCPPPKNADGTTPACD